MSTDNENPPIPPELESMLLEFTANVLVQKPRDIVNFAADYFNKLRDTRVGVKRSDSIDEEDTLDDDGKSQEYIAHVLGHRYSRRGTVMGESYDPEEDTDSEVEVYTKTNEQRTKIREKTEEVFLFRILDDLDLNAVIDAMIPTPVKKDQVIIKQGDDGDFFYLIDSGNFDIVIQDKTGSEKHVGTYEGNGFFGELALLHNQPRAATIKATSDGHLWAVSRKIFNKLIVKRAFQKRQLYMKLLNSVHHLKPLTEYEKMQVADALRGKSYSEGDIIVKEGDTGDGMYFIVEGKVSVRQMSDDGTEDKEIAQLEKGKFFGELALVKHQPRAATIVALEDTKAAFLDVKAFERLLGPCLEIMKRHAKSYE